MIGRTNVNNLQTNSVNNPTNKYINKPNNKGSNKILNIYEKDLSLNHAIYSKELMNTMDKENIEKNHLNKSVLNTMKNQGVKTTRENLTKVVKGLDKENIYKLYQKGYKIEELTIDVISSEINSDPKQEASDKEKLEDVLAGGDSLITNLMNEGDELTIDNLYKAKYKGQHKDYSQEATREELVALLSANGVKATRETINAARSLIGGNAAISKGNIKVFLNYKSAISNIEIDDIIPTDAVLSDFKVERPKLEVKEVAQLVEDIKRIDIKEIQDTYKNLPITIGNLQSTLNGVNPEDAKVEVDLEVEVKPEDIKISQRQIEEIRLKLTLEAALKLNNKIDIKTESLEKVVDELRTIERQENETILKNLDITVEDKILEDMSIIKEKLSIINTHKDLLGVKVSRQEVKLTINEMSDYAKGVGTQPEARFKEGISKVEGQIERILSLNEIDINEDNIKSAKALIQNNVDITQDNIENVKEVVVKIDTIVNELKPVLVAQMLKSGVEVDNIQVDQLIEHIRDHQIKQDPNITGKLAEAILELDKGSHLAPKERDALIGVYRMINTITKNETAAIGFLVANERELTLGNLFEASKYVKQIGKKDGKLDILIDDKTGLLESELPNNIRKIIKDGTKLVDPKETLRNWLDNIDSKELKNFEDMNKLLKDIGSKKGSIPQMEMEKLEEQVKSLKNLPKETLEFMEREKIPLTVKNLYWMNKIDKNPFLLGDLINEYESLTKENITEKLFEDSEDETRSLDDLMESIQEEIKDSTSDIMSKDNNQQAYNLGKDMQEMLSLQKDISKNETIYQLPVMLSQGTTNLNLYVMKDKKEKGNEYGSGSTKAYMSLNTKNLGVIQVHIEVINDSLSFEMVGETKKITDLLKTDISDLKSNLEEKGLNLLKSEFSWEETQTKEVISPFKARFSDSKFEHII